MKTLKTLALLLLGVILVDCTSGGGSNTGSGDGSDSGADKGLRLVVDKLFIYNNGGVDANGIATFSVLYDGVDVTEDCVIFLGEGNDAEPIDGYTFTSTAEPCTLRFWASYDKIVGEQSDRILLNIVATPPAAPAVPVDNNPTNTNFVRRVLLTQFTGTSCGYCPEMMNALYTVSNSAYFGDKFVLAAAHLYGTSDPAYLNDAKTLDKAMGVSSFPTVNADMWKNTSYRNSEKLIDLISDALDRTTVKAGIAVNAEYHEEAGYIVINTLVKAAEDGYFRIGAWLLEDNVDSSKVGQANNGYTPIEGVNFNIHNNSIRIANKSMQTSQDYTGMTLGYLNAGETKSQDFAFPLLKNWNPENLRVIVFVSTKEGNKWYVNNVVKAPKHGSVDFEYAE